MYGMSDFKTKVEKVQSTNDRLLKITPKEGFNPESSTGLVDNRLFLGDNKLHALLDTQKHLWYLKYDKGGLPEPLKVKFTTYKHLLDYVKSYFDKRNLTVTEDA